MKEHLSGLLLLIAMLAATHLHAAMLPDFEASYILKRGNLRIGSTTVSLQIDTNGNYLYESRNWPVKWVSWFLKDQLRESSRGRITADGVRPTSYHYQRTGGSREREDDFVFERKNNTVKNLVSGSTWEIDMPPDTIDNLAYQLGIMLDLQQGKKDMQFNIADDEEIDQDRFSVVGHETLTVPAGTFETVKITKVRKKSKKRQTFIWCAPALNYLPVRIWQREKDGSEYTSNLESFSETLRVMP